MRVKNYSHLTDESILRLLNGKETLVLLDNASFSEGQYRTYLFTNPVKTLKTNDPDEIAALLKMVDSLSEDYWICGYLTYETAYTLEASLNSVSRKKLPSHSMPLVWFGVFNEPCIYNHKKRRWNRKPHDTISSKLPDLSALKSPALKHRISYKEYNKIIHRIKRYIAAGDTYQVNFTYDVDICSSISPPVLYYMLRKSQPTPYSAFLRHEYGHVLSFSPEMFFRKNKKTIEVKPMKGTAPRGSSVRKDNSIRKFLSSDEKNLAENLMIVDLLRNDLGRICKSGSVHTGKLFEIETHSTLHQMTSTIKGTLKNGVNYFEIFRSLFPCGSVTGAPKIHTMEIINRLEKGPRGVYCGALGYISPRGEALFNVPIRTLQQKREKNRWQYRVGSGIVWDSDADTEFEECKTKCGFINSLMPEFDILETVLFKRGRFLYLKEHINRMKKSAEYFNYPFSNTDFQNIIKDIRSELPADNKFRVRFLLDSNGKIRWEHFPLKISTESKLPKVRISNKQLDESEPFLYHKTTHRPWYSEIMKDMKKQGLYDMIFRNSKGEVTEGAISNIFIEKNGILYTPPVNCGLLPGILRARLIKRGKCREKTIYPADLFEADAVYCGNSVRKLVKVEVVK